MVLWLIFGLLVLVQIACRSEPASPGSAADALEPDDGGSTFRNIIPGNARFVGDDACFSCHEDEYTGFKEHGMAQSLYRLTPDRAVEVFGSSVVHDSIRGFSYRTYKSDGRYYMEEYLVDGRGAKTHSLTREMQYVVGSGTSARTYLTESNGWYYELPITWYTQKQIWDFSPGYRIANKRFGRRIADRCMTCHNSYPEPAAFTNGKYSSIPLGIGCERCHGPGSLHIDERLATPTSANDIDDTIVNPAHLALERRLDVCQQCHLNTTVSILRAGRTAYDYRPSQDLSDYVSLFTARSAESEDGIGVISHADRMQKSVCFLATRNTERPMECVTCHDPHSGFRDSGNEYFNATCRTCHEPGLLVASMSDVSARSIHSKEADCVACHMPRKDVIEAPHSAFTDHWIRVVDREESTSPASPLPAHSGPLLDPYFETDRFESGAVYEGMAYVVLGVQEGDTNALEKGINILNRVIRDEADGDVAVDGFDDRVEGRIADNGPAGEAEYLRGLAYLSLGRALKAIPSFERAVTIDPDIPERLNALAQAYEANGKDPVRIERLYRRALFLQPDLSDVRINYGRFLETRNRLVDAIQAYDQATVSEPWNPLAWYNLGTAYQRASNRNEAVRALRKAIDLDPANASAWSNLGFIYIAEDRKAEALKAFTQGVLLNPDHPDALSNLGSYFLNNEEPERAVEYLLRAATVDPEHADHAAKLALAYFRLERFDDARRFAEKALMLAPDQGLARQVLDAL